VRFRLYGLSLRAYPLELGKHWLRAGLGAGFDGGFVHAAAERGPGLANPASANKTWLSALATARLSAEIEETLSLQVVPSAIFPITREEFVIEQEEETVHKAPAVGWSVVGGAVVRFE
jgi:hypothetical protein